MTRIMNRDRKKEKEDKKGRVTYDGVYDYKNSEQDESKKLPKKGKKIK